jgi:hypothetical protein
LYLLKNTAHLKFIPLSYFPKQHPHFHPLPFQRHHENKKKWCESLLIKNQGFAVRGSFGVVTPLSPITASLFFLKNALPFIASLLHHPRQGVFCKVRH